MNGDFKKNFRLIATGVKTLTKLTSSGSPLNNLGNKFLRIVSETAADKLISFGISDSFSSEVRNHFLSLTGRHPYIMQGILEKLPRNGTAVDKTAINTAKMKFMEEHRNFNIWLDGFSVADCSVYHLLAESKDGFLGKNELKDAIHPNLTVRVQDSLTTLKYHCIIDGADEKTPNKIAGTIFKEWFKENCPKKKIMLK